MTVVFKMIGSIITYCKIKTFAIEIQFNLLYFLGHTIQYFYTYNDIIIYIIYSI